ncbi:hypothetical protein ABPG72_022781 [Tetrahymena utriculariae]
MKNKICFILILTYLFVGINTQAAAGASSNCTLDSIEETILNVEGGCRCAYTNAAGQKLIGVGYNLNTQTQQSNLQQMLSLSSSDLSNIVSGDYPLTTDQILQLLTSSANLAVSDLLTIFADYKTYPAIIQIALVRIYYDLTLSGLKQLTGFVSQIQAQNFDQAAVLLQYTDKTKSFQTSYCAQQTTSCTLNAKLISECYQEQLTAAKASNTSVSTIPPTPDNDSLKDILINALSASTCNYVGSCTSNKSGGLGGSLGKSKNQQTIQPTVQANNTQDQNTQSSSNDASSSQDSQDSQQSTDQDVQTNSTDNSSDQKNTSTSSKKKKGSNKSVKNSSNTDSATSSTVTDAKTSGKIISTCIILTSLLMIISFI